MRIVLVLDCTDADALADFWAAALDLRRGRYQPPYVLLQDPTQRWPELLLQQVPDGSLRQVTNGAILTM